MVVLCCSILPQISYAATTTMPGDVSTTEAEAKIYELFNILGDGSYFTVNQKTCRAERESGHGCSNCSLEKILEESWFQNKFGSLSTTQFPRTYYSDSASWAPKGKSCFAFATFAEWYIYAETVTDKVSTKCIGTYSYNLEGVSKNIRVGDLIRLQDSKGSQSGHSAIVISYDKTGVKVLDCNYTGKQCEVHIHTIKYSSYNYYVISRATNSVICNHEAYQTKNGQYGVCRDCDYVFDWESTYVAFPSTSSVSKSGGTTLRSGAPYDDAPAGVSLKNGTEVDILGTCKNAYGNKWYKIKVGNNIYYGYSGNFKTPCISDLKVSVSSFVPANNAELEKKTQNLSGKVTSNFALQKIEAYLDGKLYATWEASNENTTTVELKDTTINKDLAFASLATGKHTITLKAYDYNNRSVQFHSSVFYIYTTACSHSYSYKTTKTPTTSATGTLTGTCSKCSVTKTVTLPKLSTSDYTYKVTKAATCTATGTGRYTWKTTTYGTFYFDVSIAKTSHSYSNATCTAPKKCSSCGATTGSALGHSYTNACDTSCNTCGATRSITHSYAAATCTAPKTCTVCGKTSGSALGHSYTNACDTSCNTCGAIRSITHTPGTAATCTEDQNCIICGEVLTEAMGHTWIDATYTDPKTCDLCGATEGDPLTLEVPTIKVTNAATGVTVSWNEIIGAESYNVYRSVYSGDKWSGWTVVKTTTSTSFTDTSVKTGTTVKYTVRAVNGKYTSAAPASISIKFLATPTVKVTNAAKGVTVSWNKVSGATTYNVYRSVYSGGKWSGWVTVKTGVTGTSYTDTSVKTGTTVKYTVRAVNSKYTSAAPGSISIKFLATPTIKVTNTDKGVQITWNKVSGAKTYTVYRSVYSGGKWSGWTVVKTTTSTSFTDTGVKSGATVKYTVRAVSGKYTSAAPGSVSIKFLATPTVKVAKTSTGIKASWDKITGAKGYIVYRRTYTNGAWSGWTKIKTTTSTSYTDTSAKKGVSYQYAVRAYNGDYQSTIKNSSSIKR